MYIYNCPCLSVLSVVKRFLHAFTISRRFIPSAPNKLHMMTRNLQRACFEFLRLGVTFGSSAAVPLGGWSSTNTGPTLRLCAPSAAELSFLKTAICELPAVYFPKIGDKSKRVDCRPVRTR